MTPVPVTASALRPGHLPVIDGTLGEVLTADRMGDRMCVRWVPYGSDAKSSLAEWPLDASVPCVRRSEVAT